MPPVKDAGWTAISPTEAAAYDEHPSKLWDAIRSVPGGLGKGIGMTLGMAGDLFNPTSTETVEGLGGAPVTVKKGERQGFPTSAQVNNLISMPTGGYYEPKTSWGRGAENVASFAPAMIGGEASLPSRFLTRALAPAASGAAAGSLVDEKTHPYLHVLAELGGAVVGGGAAEVARIGSTRIAAAMKAAQESGDVQALRKFQDLLGKTGHTADTLAAGAMPPARGQMVAEAMGPRGVTMAGTLARQAGTAAPTFENIIRARNTGRGERVLGETEQASGVAPANATNMIKDIVERGQQEAAPLFQVAENHPPPNFAGRLERLTEQPDVQQGMVTGLRNQKRLAAARDEPFDPNAYGINEFNAAGDPVLGPTPTWKTHFAGKRGLDTKMEDFRDPITREINFAKDGAYEIDQLRRSYVDELKRLNPPYAEALGKSADYLSANTAFKQAREHLLATKVPAAQVKTYFEGLSAADQAAYRAGLSDKMHQLVSNTKLFRPDVLLTPNIKTKLKIAFGEDKANTFIKAMEDETELAASGGRIRPGSQSFTFEGQEAAKDLGGHLKDAQAASEGARALATMLSGPAGIIPGTLGVGKTILHFAPNLLRTGGMTVEGRNQLANLLAMSPEELQTVTRALPPKPKVNYLSAALGK